MSDHIKGITKHASHAKQTHGLDPEEYIEEVQARYEEMTAREKEYTKQLYKIIGEHEDVMTFKQALKKLRENQHIA